MKKVKRVLSLAAIGSLTLFLAACSNKPVTSHSTGLWDHYIVYNFSRFIIWLSNNCGGYGMGIIIFTIIIRVLLLPLMFYQTKSMLKTQELAPKLKAIQKKYSSRDRESMVKMQEETSKLYKEAGVNPWASMLPMIIQLPIMWALYQAIWRTPELRHGTFLWLQLGHTDPYYILPILAALFTFLSSWLSMASMPERNAMTSAMTWFMPIMVFFMALGFSSAITLYWVVSNAFQVVQTLLLQNPFKIRREREAKEKQEKAKKRKLEKAKRRAYSSRRK
ncbi:YidC/Oxa1 family membrane protein insertase [Limosilactobacillus vaginalis]|jgi:YidC/Oxa1 family membrane protein insertase|uniref:Membrane protein insertase YidC n=3 Tax=Limosilactobacillus TaxID=2742598 RepID=A0AAP3LVR4_9LACO|nr:MULTISPECIES: YidC/Oxa1 family membrane protein insertase [Limosilactobacillus]PMC28506.1 membrane protein insertase YidC [Gardnerella vaginalis]EEJ40525.1 membrane protein insertase, YidC/Oxa1 family [Limosilactobacillus vaginalis DSM 5837 = ATCC 49540]KRM48154.1 stage III sporulation protein J precursor [Limosilactobacillus vaginalis DSM 5837 = ATCC 49540]MBU9694337.1 YidC/Oxa1 family membrane protein insertase [Limosilactobacillus portuensis]MCZ2466519.1 YidC/Oxa1 family membrane protein